MQKPPQSPAPDKRAAEELVAAWMVWAGYRDAALIPREDREHADVGATGAVALVAFGETAVDAPEIVHLEESVRGDALVFAAAGFTPDAIAFAETAGVGLFAYDPDGTVTPLNPKANEFHTRGERLPPPLSESAKGWCSFVLGIVVVALGFTIVFASCAQVIDPPEVCGGLEGPCDEGGLAGRLRGLAIGFGLVAVGGSLALWFCNTGWERLRDRSALERHE